MSNQGRKPGSGTATSPTASDPQPPQRPVGERAPGKAWGRRQFLNAGAAGGLIVILVGMRHESAEAGTPPPGEGEGKSAPPGFGDYNWYDHYWAYVIDTTKCIGCGSCMRACRRENKVPKDYFRTWIERYELREGGEAHVDVALNEQASFDADALPAGEKKAKSFFVPKICNHCAQSVCSQVCPVGASYQTEDGVVLVDAERCIGCAYCVQACPYGSRFINPDTHIADKCTLCYHRITKGKTTACVLSCPVGARMVGDLKDPKSPLHEILRERRYTLLHPELGTHPKCYYIGMDIEVK